MAHGILIIEDETSLARNIKDYLEEDGFEARCCGDGESGLKLAESFRPDFVILDLQLPGMNGLAVLRHLRARESGIKVVMLTAHGSVQTAVEAIKAGAYEYLAKPVVLSELKRVIDRALEEERTTTALSYFRRRDESRAGIDRIVGESPAILALKTRIRQLVAAEASIQGVPPPVLISGETGTGKELIARAIHVAGPRRQAPFIELNCATLPAHLIEGELFGHERGAFTDAKEKRIGLFEAAGGGTIFLDEIGELDPSLQAKLLRVIETGRVRRLGASREIAADVRVVAATNRPLKELAAEGRFRPDLYYRLSVVTLEAPPLRERGEDIVLLAEHFLRQHARRYGRQPPGLGAQARQALLRYGWPGNVRELRNLLEQIVVFHHGDEIEAAVLPFARDGAAQVLPAEGFVLPEQGVDLEELERSLTLQALTRTGWNMTQAGRLLGMSRDAMRYRVDKYGLRLEDGS
ncbi:sigma-54-dependent transcriptional regulator [Benzoatithermus flavus]|uniref:Sigma-54 dependent transcriptional regulator n=1 Tax=Benzoatithermus flavus TaxID=3108223 RepID=A0ABU8XSK9_9PROT